MVENILPPGDSTRRSVYSLKDIEETLYGLGCQLLEPYKGSTNKKHKIRFKNGAVKVTQLRYVLTGENTGARAYRDDARIGGRYTREEVEEKLKILGCKLLEPYRGSLRENYLIEFPSGLVKSARLCNVLNGKQKGLGCHKPGSKTGRGYSVDEVNDALLQKGCVLLEDYKGSTRKTHLIKFPTGLIKSTRIESVISGKDKGVRSKEFQTLESVNSKLHPASLAEPFKGSVNKKHKVFYPECSHTVETFINHKGSYDCPHCNVRGFNGSLPARLYVIRVKVQNSFLYKVGITNRTIRDRYWGEGIDYEVVCEFICSDGHKAKFAESLILKKFLYLKYNGSSPFNYTGVQELFTEDVSQNREFAQIISMFNLT